MIPINTSKRESLTTVLLLLRFVTIPLIKSRDHNHLLLIDYNQNYALFKVTFFFTNAFQFYHVEPREFSLDISQGLVKESPSLSLIFSCWN